jgi:hypothetical protein
MRPPAPAPVVDPYSDIDVPLEDGPQLGTGTVMASHDPTTGEIHLEVQLDVPIIDWRTRRTGEGRLEVFIQTRKVKH